MFRSLLLTLAVVFVFISYNTTAQTAKPKNMSSLKKDSEFYSKVYAKDLATNIGLNKTQEAEIAQIYLEYSNKAVQLRKSNPELLEEQLPLLNKDRDAKIQRQLSDKQKVKFTKYQQERNKKRN